MFVKITIDCYLSHACIVKDSLQDTIQRALATDDTSAHVTFYTITDGNAAELGLKGSPCIVINGNVLQPIETNGLS